jgi:ferrochelatase
MKISSIVDIVDGNLLNKPAISFVTQSHTNLKKVNDGDLFISSDISEILQAINQGAFAIISDCSLDSFENKEIALIKVPDLQNACISLLRFYLSNKSLIAYYTDDISFELFYLLKNNKEIVLLEDDISDIFEQLKSLENISTLISKNQKILSSIFPLSNAFEVKEFELKNLIVHSLFETTFSHQDTYYLKLKLSKIYVNNLLAVLEFLKIKELETIKLKEFKYMNAIFINPNYQIVEYGKSNKFIISNENLKIANNEIEFLQKNYTYAIVKIYEASLIDEFTLDYIQEEEFNALYIKGKNTQQIINLLEHNYKKEISLL